MIFCGCCGARALLHFFQFHNAGLVQIEQAGALLFQFSHAIREKFLRRFRLGFALGHEFIQGSRIKGKLFYFFQDNGVQFFYSSSSSYKRNVPAL